VDEADKTYRNYLSTRLSFQTQIDQVTVFGSDQAIAAERRLSAVLPPTQGRPIDTGGELRKPPTPDPKNFAATYAGFQTVFCREASATPRSGCST
jgi:hypothetical protein